MEENKNLFERFQECVQKDDFSSITDDELTWMIDYYFKTYSSGKDKDGDEISFNLLKRLNKEYVRRTAMLSTMSMEKLEECFKRAIENDSKYIAVKIETRGSEGAEIIINPRCNFEAKLEYYKKAYTDDLVLKTYDGIKIVGFCDSDTFDFIDFMLGDN